MQNEIFYISLNTSNGMEWKEVLVESKSFEKYGVKMFVMKENDEYIVFHVDSGTKICSGKTESEAVSKLDKIIKEIGKDDFIRKADDFIYKVYKKAGTNPREIYKKIKAGMEKLNETSELFKLDTENGHDLIVTYKVKYETPKELLNFLKNLYPNFFSE